MPRLPLARSLAAALVTLAAATSAEAALFNFSFDNNFLDGTLSAPIVGTGTLSFSGNATAGTTVWLSSLSNLAISFSFGSQTFDESDIATPLANVLVQFTSSGTDVLANFGGLGGGPFGGSLDFTTPGSSLSFQPDFGSLYFQDTFGDYRGVLANTGAVPEPGSIALIGLALVAAGAARRRG